MHTSSMILLVLSVGLTTAAGASFVAVVLARRFRTVSYLTNLLGQQYGFVRRHYQADYQVYTNGSYRAKISEVIKAITLAVSGVEHYSQILPERAQDIEPFIVRAIKTEKRGGSQSSIKVIAKPTLITPKKLFYQLLFEPQLQPKEEVEYSFEVVGPPSTFALSEDELFERKLPYDFVSMKIAYPTEKFVMTIQFPEDLRAEDISYDVWLGDARLRLENEYQRLKREISSLKVERLDTGQVARLVVAYPILDLKYVITWRPTKREEL